MDAGSAYLVDHTLVPVGPGVEIYPEDGLWAQPDVEHAAALMRRVVEEPGEAARRAAQGRGRVRSELSPAACGARMRARLERTLETLPRHAVAPADVVHRDALDAALRQSAYDPEASATGTHPKDVARRSALHAMRPFTAHQQELNQRLVAALEETHAMVDDALHRLWELERMAPAAQRLSWRVRSLERRMRDDR